MKEANQRKKTGGGGIGEEEVWGFGSIWERSVCTCNLGSAEHRLNFTRDERVTRLCSSI